MQNLELNGNDSLKIKLWSRAKKSTSQIYSPTRSARLSLASANEKELRASSKNMDKFNDKIRKKNSKFSKRRKSKSSTRKEKKVGKNSILGKLENRVPK